MPVPRVHPIPYNIRYNLQRLPRVRTNMCTKALQPKD